ncbi:shikimate kinase [Evansella cellulosilytica]|uniref:Shikimate kinase n=1 Tax=Evansella cellulosilytica (strain ATCC 21833 / DSM 2522 / FERM P-1141 / JCM 9156 / N-4) TaxID=649639 RepID=E6TWZ5_EVAC2|nr:shikimate kinase [Evansella cellulosilytica]ADU29945.1 shikimate kinase [Evansella cellulosilytica DSM 2522]
MKNIYLIGFMGAGKTTIGQLLAKEAGAPFIDLDELISEKSQLSIPDIFEQFGEDGFRRRETEALKSCHRNGTIIATGGGIVERRENIEIMKNSGTIVFLDVPFEKIYERIQDDPNRPITKFGRDALKERYTKRLPLYKEANIVISEVAEMEETVQLIKESLCSKDKKA